MQEDIIPLPFWWASRDRLVAGAVWTKYNHESHPGIRHWLARWMEHSIQEQRSIEEVVWLGNSLRYFSNELFYAVRETLYRQIQLLCAQGQQAHYPTRSLEIMLPTLIEMGAFHYVLD